MYVTVVTPTVPLTAGIVRVTTGGGSESTEWLGAGGGTETDGSALVGVAEGVGESVGDSAAAAVVNGALATLGLLESPASTKPPTVATASRTTAPIAMTMRRLLRRLERPASRLAPGVRETGNPSVG